MTEDRQPLFQVETVTDEPLWKDVWSLYPLTIRKNKVLCIISIVLLLLFGVMVIRNPHFALAVLIGFGIGRTVYLIQHLRSGNRKAAYQKILDGNEGRPPHIVFRFTEDGIASRNIHRDAGSFYGYTQVTGIVTHGNLLFLFLETNRYYVLDLDWLTGGTRDELIEFLSSRCTNAKKGVQTVTVWKTLRKLQTILSALVLGTSLILSAVQLLSPAVGSSGDLSYREAAALLEKLDIHCSEEMILEAGQQEAEYRAFLEEISAELGYMPEFGSSEDRFLSLLCSAGYGTYDYDTWQWIPSASGVYWLDFEAMDVGSMYTQYLRGLEAISDGTLVITDIVENHDGVDFEKGTGDISLSFTVNGKKHQLIIPMDYDWYDVRALDEINQLIGSVDGRQVYAASDGGQGVLLFFRSKPWAAEFRKTTGIPLLEKISRLWYGYPY